MKIADKSYVAIDYCLSLDTGEEIDRSPEGSPLAFIVGYGQIIPGLEKELMGKGNGDSMEIIVQPEDGYGLKRDDLYQEIPRANFPSDEELAVGMSFQAAGPQGPVVFTVHEIKDDTVSVDLNHPMAGKILHFSVKVVEVRELSKMELASLESDSDGCGCGCGGSEKSDQCGSGCSC